MVQVLVREKDMPHPPLPPQVSEQAERAGVDRNLLIHEVRRQKLAVGARDARGEKFDPHRKWPPGGGQPAKKSRIFRKMSYTSGTVSSAPATGMGEPALWGPAGRPGKSQPAPRSRTCGL